MFAILAGASYIDHADRLRAGATRRVLLFSIMAPTTLGMFLRVLTFGHVRQLEAVIGETLRRAWSLGKGPGNKAMTIDVDSTIVPVYGYHKHGAAYGYTRHLGYHPLLATRADTGEVLHARLRKGSANTQRGTKRFVEELIARFRRCGAAGPLSLRADLGFYSSELMRTCVRLGVAYSITVNLNTSVKAAIDAIEKDAWQTITYTDGSEAEVAETTYVTGSGRRARSTRLVVRRTRILDPAVQQLFPTWRHRAFVTNVELDTVAADAFHRDHATVELAIKDLKEGAGLEHCPSGRFFGNAAWLCCAVLAHDLCRWTSLFGGIGKHGALTVSRTVRRQFFALPGRLVNRSGTPTLRLPKHWPWAEVFSAALERLTGLRLVT